MRTKTEKNTEKINILSLEIMQLMKIERQKKATEFLEKIMHSCTKDAVLDRNILLELFQKVHKKAVSTEEKPGLKETWNNQELSLKEKAEKLAEYLAKLEPLPSFINHMGQFLEIITEEKELNLFLKNPQEYIYSHSNLSVHDLQVLQFVINDPNFKSLPSINRSLSSSTDVFTPLAYYLHQLHVDKYGSMDALRFPQCINPKVKDQVLKASNKAYYGPQIMGNMGAQQSYDRGSIAKTAAKVKELQMGACHTFAQLAADHLLKLMDEGKLPRMPLKLVSHKENLYSHTFLLYGHQSDDLTDLSQCLIIDPWAVAMGYNSTYGIFTEENYPYPEMTTKLECCFDSVTPSAESKKSNSLNQELSTALLRGSFFSTSNQNRNGEKLSSHQQIAVSFITNLKNHTHHGVKKELMEKLIESIKKGTLTPEDSLKMATLAIHAKVIEKVEQTYKWKGIISNSEEGFVSLFNKSTQKFWMNYLFKEMKNEGQVGNIDSILLDKIVQSLNETTEHEFNPESTLSNKMGI
ncbi:MAG: hypothetical protein QM652_07795 [Legionella sp.]|uniref:hypothetical protein n=1 Tax=Legionella sp. TaxID=459 RepID=UPI0039E47889